jgi:hypothetical protein
VSAAGTSANGRAAGLRIEHSRKHGPFDPRYPPILHEPAPASLWRVGQERLDWRGFLARFFPESRRHDLDALAAYESYTNDVEDRPATPDTEATRRTALRLTATARAGSNDSRARPWPTTDSRGGYS